MILESAYLHIKPDQTASFEQDFQKASSIIQSMEGFLSLRLSKCIENDHQYLLLVEWRSLEDHTIGFRQSDQYQEWKALLHHYYDPFPVVEHFKTILKK